MVEMKITLTRMVVKNQDDDDMSIVLMARSNSLAKCNLSEWMEKALRSFCLVKMLLLWAQGVQALTLLQVRVRRRSRHCWDVDIDGIDDCNRDYNSNHNDNSIFCQTYAADIFFGQSWEDHRLKLPANMTG